MRIRRAEYLVSVGLMLGPALGGLITGTAGWRYIFLLPVPAMLLAAMFGGRILQETPRAEGERFDFVGTLLLALWVVPLFFVLNQGPKAGWGSGLITTLTLLTMVMLVAFLVAQLRAAQPVVALTVFRNQPNLFSSNSTQLARTVIPALANIGPNSSN